MAKKVQTTALISYASKVMPQILQARLQQHMKKELPDVQAGFRKGRGTRDQIANIHWIIEIAREFKKNIYSCFIDSATAFDCMDHNKLENSSIYEVTRPPYLLPRNLYEGWETTVRTGQETMDCFQLGKRVCQGSILSLCLLNFYAEYIMQKARLDEAQAKVKNGGRKTSNLRYAYDTTLMSESKEYLKSLLI